MGFAEVKTGADSPTLALKVLEAVAFLAPMTVAMPATLTDAQGVLQPLPTGFWPLGLMNNDGVDRKIDITKEEVESFGYANPTRTDITAAKSTISITAQEYGRKNLLELFYGVSLTGVTQGPSGEVIFSEPALPLLPEYRLITVGRDGTIDNEWLIGVGYPRVKLASLPNGTWKKGEQFEHPLEFDVFVDTTLGTAVKHYMGGTAPKATAMRTKLGFTQVP